MSEIKRLLNSLLWDIYGCVPFNVNRKISKTRQMKMLPTLYEPLLLEKLSSKVLNDICRTLQVEIRLMSKYLERVLISRDRNRTQQNILYGFLDVIVSSRLGESSREMRFSLSPPPPQGATKGRVDPGAEETTSSSDFNQWLHAMKMVARLPGGMPPEFRRKLWLALAEKYLKSKNVDWGREEVKCFSEQWREDDEELGIQIVKDLHRTGSSLCSGPAGTINQAKLKRILLGYARYNPEVGYCQGFNMLGALILQVMDKEEIESIKVMIYLVEGILPSGYFSGSLGGLQADMAVFRELMTCKLPRLAKHLQKLQGPVENAFEPPLTNVFTMQWFLTMFCTCLPMTCVLRVWDLVLIEGSDVLLRTALVLWSLLEERILNARTADDFYCKMGSFSSELLNGHLIDSNGLIEKVVELGPVPELQKLRDKHLYNISPFRDKKGLQIYYSDEEGDSDEDSRMAVATAWGLRLTRRGSAGLSNRTDSKDRIALDISLLKKQYDRLRERQRQAHIILTSAVARQGSNPNQSSIQMNQLLMGRNAIVTNNGRRLGPPPGAIPPARKVSLPTAKSPKMAQGKSLRRGETLHWRDTDLSKRRRGSLKWKDIKSDSSQSGQDDRTPQLVESAPSSRSSSSEPKSQRSALKASRQRSDSSSYSEDSDGNSSTSTSLCDEDDHEVCEINASSLEGSPLKKSKSSKKHSEVPHKKCLEDVLNSNEKQHGTDCQIPFIQLSTMDSPVPQTNKTDNDSLEYEKEDSGTESNRLDYAGFVDEFSWPDMNEATSSVPFDEITIDGTSDEGDFLSLSNIITSTSQLSPMPDITTYINNSSISPLRTPISAFDYANLLVSMDESKNFDVNDEGVTNEYFERINIVERPTKLDLLYSLNEEDSIRNAFKTPSCQPTPEDLFVQDDPVKEKEHACSSEVTNVQNEQSIQLSAEEMDRKMKVLLEYSNQSSLSFIAEAKHEICSGLFKTKEFDTESLKYQSSALVPITDTLGARKSKADETFEHIFTVPSVTTIYKTSLPSNTENNEKMRKSALGEKTQCQSPSKNPTELNNHLSLVEKSPNQKEDDSIWIIQNSAPLSEVKSPSGSKDNQQTQESVSAINQRDLDNIPTTEDLETRFRALEMTFTAGKRATIIETSSEYESKTRTSTESMLDKADLKTTQKIYDSDEKLTSDTSPSKEKVCQLNESDTQNYVPYAQQKQLDSQDSDVHPSKGASAEDGINCSLMKQSIEDFDFENLAAKNTSTSESLMEAPEVDHFRKRDARELTDEHEHKEDDSEPSLLYCQNHFNIDIDPQAIGENTALSDKQGDDTKSEVSKDSEDSCHYDKDEKLIAIESVSDTTSDDHKSTLMLLSYSENHFREKNISQSKFVNSFTNSEFLFKTNTISEKPKRHSFHDYDKLDQSNVCHEMKANLTEDGMTSKDAVELTSRRKSNIPSTEDLESRFKALERQFSDKTTALPKDTIDSVNIIHHGDHIMESKPAVSMEKSGTPLDSGDEIKFKETNSQTIKEEPKSIPSTADLEQRFLELERQLSASNLNQPKKTTDTKEEHSKALKQSNNTANPSIVFTNNEDTKPINPTKVVRKTINDKEDEPPFIRKRIPSTEDLETRFEALEIQKSLRSPTNLLSPSKMTEFLNCVPELETVAKRKSDIPSTEDLESRFKALEQNRLDQKASNETPNMKSNIIKSDTAIPSTKDLESRFEALEQRKSVQESTTTTYNEKREDSSVISVKTIKMESKKVPSTEDLEIRFKTLEESKNVKTNDSNIAKTNDETNPEIMISENKTKSRGLEYNKVPTIEDLETRYEALEQKKTVIQKLTDENFALRNEEKKPETLSKAKEQAISSSDETRKSLQSDQTFKSEPVSLQSKLPDSNASLDKELPSSVDGCSMHLSVQAELENKPLKKNLEEEQKILSKVPSTHDLERRFNKLQIDTKISKNEQKSIKEEKDKQDAEEKTSNTKTAPKRKDLYKIESQSDETLTSTDQTSIEFESKSESRPTSCPECRDPFDSNNGTTDMVLKIIEENSKILHRILKKTLADSVESGAEADAQSKKSHSGITDSLLALGNIFPGTDEVTSPSRFKSHSWIRPPIALRSDDNISDRLASIKSTIKSIDTLCEEKSFHKEKCQRYIDSLFARPTKPSVTAPNPLIKVDNIECKQSQEHVTKRELKKDTSPRRRRDEDREEYESRVRRNLMPNSIETPSDHSFSLENTEHVDSEVDRIIQEKQLDTQVERISSPYSVSGYDLSKRSITPVVYIPTKLEIRHTTVTSTFYDRYLTEKHIERTFPRSRKSPISPQATKSFLDIAGYSPMNDRNSKSAENSPSRRKDTNESPVHEKLSAATNKRTLISTLDVAQKDLHIRSCDNILLQLRSSTNNKDIVPSIMVYNPLPTKIRKPPELGISLGMYKDYGTDESSKS